MASTLVPMDAKIRIKSSSIAGAIPSIGPSLNHTDGTWGVNDIYVSEFFLNVVDKRLWIGTLDGVLEIFGTSSYNSAEIMAFLIDFRDEMSKCCLASSQQNTHILNTLSEHSKTLSFLMKCCEKRIYNNPYTHPFIPISISPSTIYTNNETYYKQPKRIKPKIFSPTSKGAISIPYIPGNWYITNGVCVDSSGQDLRRWLPMKINLPFTSPRKAVNTSRRYRRFIWESITNYKIIKNTNPCDISDYIFLLEYRILDIQTKVVNISYQGVNVFRFLTYYNCDWTTDVYSLDELTYHERINAEKYINILKDNCVKN